MGMIDFVIPPSVCFSGYFFGAVEPKARCFLLFASYRIVIGEVLGLRPGSRTFQLYHPK